MRRAKEHEHAGIARLNNPDRVKVHIDALTNEIEDLPSEAVFGPVLKCLQGHAWREPWIWEEWQKLPLIVLAGLR